VFRKKPGSIFHAGAQADVRSAACRHYRGCNDTVPGINEKAGKAPLNIPISAIVGALFRGRLTTHSPTIHR
jgi:hypothetical protein